MAFCSNIDVPRDYHTKWNKPKTNIMWYLLYMKSEGKKRYKLTYLQNRNRPTNKENKLMVTKEKREGEG